jgi:hypothetical protein
VGYRAQSSRVCGSARNFGRRELLRAKWRAGLWNLRIGPAEQLNAFIRLGRCVNVQCADAMAVFAIGQAVPGVSL